MPKGYGFSGYPHLRRAVPAGIDVIKYGLLYNWYAATDVRNIAADGWRTMNRQDILDLLTYLGDSDYIGGRIKETGLTYWISPNRGALNDVGFNARGSGRRTTYGEFQGLQVWLDIWGSYGPTETNGDVIYAAFDSSEGGLGGVNKKFGCAIRVRNENTRLGNGEAGIYTGNDGKKYRTICINGVEYLADNLAESKFRTGESIAEITDGAAWAALTTAALCAYNNDWSNV